MAKKYKFLEKYSYQLVFFIAVIVSEKRDSARKDSPVLADIQRTYRGLAPPISAIYSYVKSATSAK